MGRLPNFALRHRRFLIKDLGCGDDRDKNRPTHHKDFYLSSRMSERNNVYNACVAFSKASLIRTIHCLTFSPPRSVAGFLRPEPGGLGTAFSPQLSPYCPVIVLLLLSQTYISATLHIHSLLSQTCLMV